MNLDVARSANHPSRHGEIMAAYMVRSWPPSWRQLNPVRLWIRGGKNN